MGRYYSGDIEGKFWYAVQSSNDASFFGGTESEPNYLEYYFDKSDKGDIEDGIAKCRKALADYKKKLDDFFAANNGYNEDMLVQAGFPKGEAFELVAWYARLELGEKILKCVEKTGQCYFEAET